MPWLWIGRLCHRAFIAESVSTVFLSLYYLRWADASTSDDKVIVVGHAFDGFDNFAFIIGNDFYTTKVDTQGEAPFSEVGLK